MDALTGIPPLGGASISFTPGIGNRVPNSQDGRSARISGGVPFQEDVVQLGVDNTRRSEEEYPTYSATGTIQGSPATSSGVPVQPVRAIVTDSATGNGEAEEAGKDESPSQDVDATQVEARAAEEVSADEEKALQEMKRRDREVRTHEQAHIAASGGVSVSGPTYAYEKGPDGQQYAVSGEVQIDVSRGNTPEETISKARQIRAAANAPAQPSAQDKSVAAQASQMESEARQELAREKQGTQGGASASGRVGQSDPAATGAETGSSERAGGTENADAVTHGRAAAESASATGSRSVAWAAPVAGTALFASTEGLESDVLQRGARKNDLLRAAQAYSRATPTTEVAPMSAGISLAV